MLVIHTYKKYYYCTRCKGIIVYYKGRLGTIYLPSDKNHNKQRMNRKKKNQSLVKITILKHQKCLVMSVPEQKTTSKNHTFIH